MCERSPGVPLVRSGLFGYQLSAPLIDSQTRYVPAIMWSQVVVGQANLSISYGKMNDRRSPPHGPGRRADEPAVLALHEHPLALLRLDPGVEPVAADPLRPEAPTRRTARA